jgi:hypothetical protein
MGRALDFVGECNCEVLEGNPAFPAGAVKGWSVPRRNLPVRSPAVNRAKGDRKVQFSSFSARSRSRKAGI